MGHSTPQEEITLKRPAPKAIKICRGDRGIKMKIHGLRHTAATQLLNAGCPIASIQAILGHKKLDTTIIYARVHDRTVEQDYSKAMERE